MYIRGGRGGGEASGRAVRRGERDESRELTPRYVFSVTRVTRVKVELRGRQGLESCQSAIRNHEAEKRRFKVTATWDENVAVVVGIRSEIFNQRRISRNPRPDLCIET
jgi:hypothetical protein